MNFTFQPVLPVYNVNLSSMQNPNYFFLQPTNNQVNPDMRGNNKPKNRFSKKEDDLLRMLVNEQKEKIDWKYISGLMNGRTARQCRERYNDYLRPNILNGIWTDEEDQLLIKLYEKLGPQWSTIAQHFPKRSRVNIKNHYKCIATKQFKKIIISQLSSVTKNISLNSVKKNQNDVNIKEKNVNQINITLCQVLSPIQHADISLQAILNHDNENPSNTK